jgi:radical SAM protein with 4Fe4S-binding SPASM domain
VANVRPYIFVRLEDNLLIKRPNQAHKLNATGARVLKALLDGRSIAEVLADVKADEERTREIAVFLCAIRQSLEGTLDIFSTNPAVETIPFDMQFSSLPVLSEVALTYRCNLACAFCYAGCNGEACVQQAAKEMTVAQVQQVLRTIFGTAKVPSVSFTGGEPALVKELPQHIQYAHDLGMRVNLITNATRIDARLARTLAASGLDSAQVSLEGVTAEVHERLTRSVGSFAATLAGIRHLRNAGIHTHTNTTLTCVNLAQSTAFPAFVKEQFGFDRFSMNLIIPVGSGSANAELIVRYSGIGPRLEQILAASRHAGVEFMWYSPVPMCMFNSVVHGLGNRGCAACDGLLSVAPNGDVLPCASHPHAVGNLLKDDFTSLWQSAAACRYRDKQLAHSACRSCEHFALCNGACFLYWDTVGYAELDGVVAAIAGPGVGRAVAV